MKKHLLTILAVLSVGAVASVRADDSGKSTPAARNAALFASDAIRISPIYVVNGVTYYHRRVIGYRTDKITTYVNGVEYVRYKRRQVYTYW